MSAGVWVNRDRAHCDHCGSAHVIRRGVGKRTYTTLKGSIRLPSQRYQCKGCEKSWTVLHKDASEHGLVTRDLEAHIVKLGAEKGGRAKLSRDLRMPILRVSRIYKLATADE
jgi:transposase-like protein